MKLWVTTATSCDSCGGEMAVLTTTATPTSDQIEGVKNKIGSMWCITVRTVEVEVDGDPTIWEVTE